MTNRNNETNAIADIFESAMEDSMDNLHFSSTDQENKVRSKVASMVNNMRQSTIKCKTASEVAEKRNQTRKFATTVTRFIRMGLFV